MACLKEREIEKQRRKEKVSLLMKQANKMKALFVEVWSRKCIKKPLPHPQGQICTKKSTFNAFAEIRYDQPNSFHYRPSKITFFFINVGI